MDTCIVFALGGTLDRSRRRRPIGGSLIAFLANRSLLIADSGVYPNTPEPDAAYVDIGALKLPLVPGLRLDIEGGSPTVPMFRQIFDYEFDDVTILVTHGHADHIGTLPLLYRLLKSRRPHVPVRVVMTIVTHDISEWSWSDHLALAGDRIIPRLFSAEDVRRLRQAIEVVAPGERLTCGSMFEVECFAAGHLPGAVSFKITVCTSPAKRVFVTGDVGFQRQYTVPGAPRLGQDELGKIDLLITESTYGDRDIRPHDEVEALFVARIVSVLRDQQGVVLLPSLATRAPELWMLLAAHGITEEWPVYIDGAAKHLTNLVTRRMGIAPPRELYVHPGVRDRVKWSASPKIVIATSGMLVGGPARGYLGAVIEGSQNLVALTCYQDPRTLGYALLATPRGNTVAFDGRDHEVMAEVRQYHLSGHASGPELAEMIRRISPARTLLVHGERRAMSVLRKSAGGTVAPMFLGETYEL